ncbi:MAG TPA: beta-galactosidase [Bryobacteraceae bacterium]
MSGAIGVFRKARAASLAALILMSAPMYSQRAQTAKAKPPTPPTLLMGAAWYPEQWPESRWKKDLELMQKAHIHMVRMGEYTWSRDEPEEGHYDLDWMERAIDLAGKHGIFVVIGTPTQAPPAWLTQKYPETLRVSRTGQRAQRDHREIFNWADPKYRELVRGIDEQLAKRFGHNPYVIAWQIDNEYSRASYDANTKAQFQNWLKAKYKTLDNFNRRLVTAYWGQTYTNWDQIPIPDKRGSPGLMLNWKEFVSDTWRSYQKNQIDAIRKYAALRQRITTNMMGWFDGYNAYVVSRDLDFSAWDDPLGQWKRPFNPLRNDATGALVRGFKDQNFWVMETTAGSNGGAGSNMVKGEMRAALWNDIANGAVTTSYWQWRDAPNGQEQNHVGVLVGIDGTPKPMYTQIAQVGREYEKAGPAIAGTSVKSEVAIIQSYKSRWTLNWQKENPHYNPVAEIMSYYEPLHELGQSIDIVSPMEDLSKYKLVVAPGLNVMPKAVADNLMRYVRQGGNLVLGQRSGMKDGDNSRWSERQPGPLTEMLGGRVEQYLALIHPFPVTGNWGENEDRLYAERLQVEAPDVKVLMRYGKSNGWLDGNPAAITRKVGHGTITYIGIWMNDAGMKRAAQWMLSICGVKPDLPPVPEGVDVGRRVGSGKMIFVFENFSSARQTISLPHAMGDVLAGGTVRSVTLPVYGVAVLESKESRKFD